MPKVGGKKFAYTPEGEAAAAEYAQQTGAPFQMRAKAFNNSPMQKNFGDSLAINKKLDKNSGNNPGQPGPILKKTGVTSKLDKSSMQGGMTGRVSLGELDGPLKKNVSSPLKKGGASPTPTKSKGGTKPAPKLTKFNTGVQKTAKTIGGNIKTGVGKFAKSVGLKKTGNIGAKLKQKYSPKAQRAGTVARPGESQFQFKTRTRKSTPKVKTGHKGGDVLTKNIKDISQKGDEQIRAKIKKSTPTVANKPKIKKHTGPPMRNVKVDHSKGLKGLKPGSVARNTYYKKHKLKQDKTSKINFLNF